MDTKFICSCQNYPCDCPKRYSYKSDLQLFVVSAITAVVVGFPLVCYLKNTYK